jgi:hypothetical protein
MVDEAEKRENFRAELAETTKSRAEAFGNAEPLREKGRVGRSLPTSV